MLWLKEINIENPYKLQAELFIPNNQSVVFWYRGRSLLVALDLITGETLWEAKVPDQSAMRLHDDKFFVTSYQGFDLEDAPVRKNQNLPDCSFGGDASLLTYDANTGEQLWGYVYHGVDSYSIFFEDQNVYLTGSNDHGNSNSIAQINANSGELISLKCNKWPATEVIPSPPKDEGYIPSPYRVVFDKEDLEWRDVLLFFAPEGNRLNILEGDTKEVMGYVDFDGAELNPWHVDMAVQNDIAVIYLGDSKQLFSLRLPFSVEQLKSRQNGDKADGDEHCCECD